MVQFDFSFNLCYFCYMKQVVLQTGLLIDYQSCRSEQPVFVWLYLMNIFFQVENVFDRYHVALYQILQYNFDHLLYWHNIIIPIFKLRTCFSFTSAGYMSIFNNLSKFWNSSICIANSFPNPLLWHYRTWLFTFHLEHQL